ncbi:MAG TPA: hypothetical protein VM513_08205 [Kofleriaceae bacterium]|jgi:RNA polymerase-binding transcription factor DksA|nr:hypothetical protein [Kofleriaceae bacterium]
MANTVYQQCRVTLQAERRALELLLDSNPSDELRIHLQEIEDALRRLVHGHFGTCEHCKRKIPDEELGHVPAARFCTECIAVRRPVITSSPDVE